ncbi:hypothetical protein [Desulfosarcina ovata]|uniref:hypothetical protein n=1 Tax=Desulfosarcina ovata TaxID=83564 RepID=UPI0012D30872|nr:hypothetical protein [Desulfosarcina ovata]
MEITDQGFDAPLIRYSDDSENSISIVGVSVYNSSRTVSIPSLDATKVYTPSGKSILKAPSPATVSLSTSITCPVASSQSCSRRKLIVALGAGSERSEV